MVRQLRAEQTRTTIITAAAELFDRQGYESTSLSDIVDQAQVTKGALYFHFAAKEDLAHTILEMQAKASRQISKEMDGRGYSSLETLIRVTFGMTRLAVEGPIPRAGLRLAAGRSRYGPRCRTPSPSGWTSPPANSPAPSRRPTPTPTPTWTPWPVRSSASSSASASWAAPSNRWRYSPAEPPRCGIW